MFDSNGVWNVVIVLVMKELYVNCGGWVGKL